MTRHRHPSREAARREIIDEALAGDERRIFTMLLERVGIRSIEPNGEFAAQFGDAVAELRSDGDDLLRELLTADVPWLGKGAESGLRFVAAHVLGARILHGHDVKDGWTTLHDLAEDPHKVVRDGVVAALVRIATVDETSPDAMVQRFSQWTDGFLHAAVALQVLSHRPVLERIRDATALLARLQESLELVESAPRSAHRSQGLRTLRDGLAPAIAACAPRFAVVLVWVVERAQSRDRDVRRIMEEVVTALMDARLDVATLDTIRAGLDEHAPPRRDPRTYVGPTRGRGRKAHRRKEQ